MVNADVLGDVRSKELGVRLVPAADVDKTAAGVLSGGDRQGVMDLRLRYPVEAIRGRMWKIQLPGQALQLTPKGERS